MHRNATRIGMITMAAGLTAFGTLGGPAGCGFKIEPDPTLSGTGGAPSTQRTAAETEPAPRPAPPVDGRPLRDQAIERLMAMTGSLNPQVRANAVEGLERAGVRAESAIALALQDENPGVRSVAAMVAGRAGLSSLGPTLRSMLGDESEFVRASAAASLFMLRQRVDPSELSAMVLEARNPRVRAHAAFLLGEMGDESAVPMLRQAWGTPIRAASEIERRLVRLQIVEALIKLGDETSVDAVRAALYPSRPEELEATALAVQIIGEVRDRGSIDQLIYLSDNEGDRVMPAEVRLAVAEALAKMGLTQGGFIASEYDRNPNEVVRAQAAMVYGRTGRTEHLERLRAMLDDPSELVRVAAAAGVVELAYGGSQAGADGPGS